MNHNDQIQKWATIIVAGIGLITLIAGAIWVNIKIMDNIGDNVTTNVRTELDRGFKKMDNMVNNVTANVRTELDRGLKRIHEDMRAELDRGLKRIHEDMLAVLDKRNKEMLANLDKRNEEMLAEQNRNFDRINGGLARITENERRSNTLFNAHCSCILSDIEYDLTALMEDFSSRLPDPESLDQLQKYYRIVEQMLRLINIEYTSERCKFQIFSNIFQIMKSVKLLKDDLDRLDLLPPIDRDKKITSVINHWENMNISLLLESNDQDFINKVNAWRFNAMGVLYLLKYRKTKPRDTDIFKLAIARFIEAKNANPRYSRPHCMLAVANSYKFKRSLEKFKEDPNDENVKKELENYLINGRDVLEGCRMASTDRALSTFFNLRANFYILESELYKPNDPNKVLSFLNDAQLEIEKVENHAQIHPVIYITKAQILCHMLDIRKVIEQLDVKKKEDWRDEILRLVSFAHGADFKFETKNKKEFFKKYPFFSYLDKLGIPYGESLLSKAGIQT